MYKDIINSKKADFETAFSHAKNDVASIRTGRASSSMVEEILCDYLGTKMRVKELATINVPEPRVISIVPWDKQAIPGIEKGIKESALSLNPVTLPALTEERRKEFTRLLGQKIEESRIKVRQVREEILKRVQAEVKEKKAREDDLHKAKEELQKLIDDLNKRFDELYKKKEQELLNS
ncbi:MAG: Ribosome-recycling factor [Candidatus Yanofskybacteria bacterium GW2011_GWD2_39_48]|uniref:Ribosome-recycling factor n=1 Tax=Candidatus Yanofskybacteria bacterium GW2011_GWD2_39_48 TaxID=1619031 RepID=A0A0G0PB12_9BACT|nr:MAG: Ribosome-recycling factor [Candidatus Yanofskybacteria bacterium GW2011_GWD2_39_48]